MHHYARFVPYRPGEGYDVTTLRLLSKSAAPLSKTQLWEECKARGIEANEKGITHKKRRFEEWLPELKKAGKIHLQADQYTFLKIHDIEFNEISDVNKP